MYIDHIEKAAENVLEPATRGARDRLISQTHLGASMQKIETELYLSWADLEKKAREEHYEVLPGSERLRILCNLVGSLLYAATWIGGNNYTRMDVEHLRIKDAEYGGSWQRRGGPGAFFAACRKWDRLEQSVMKYGSLEKALKEDQRAEGVLDDIGDLRRYLILWEAWRLDLESRQIARPDNMISTLEHEPND